MRPGLAKLTNLLPPRTLETLDQAHANSEQWLERARKVVDAFLEKNGVPRDKIVVVALGSVGRREALAASDLDLMPVMDGNIMDEGLDKALRQTLRDELKIKVSQGEDLTQRTTTAELTNPEAIGTDDDSTSLLSRRIMVLTESAVAGGGLQLDDVRNRILSAYGEERTSGRHVHSFCNDVARYYRTLCIEYKAKVDVHSKDWATRNVKLRHSRKVWYFSCILACAATGDRRDDKTKRVLAEFAKPPVDRIVDAIESTSKDALPLAGQVLESYAWFLEFMADAKNRAALEQVVHKERYRPSMENPFPTLKFNSDLLHTRTTALLEALHPVLLQRVLAWFLL